MEELVRALSEKFGVPVDAVWQDITGLMERFITYKFWSDIIWGIGCFLVVGVAIGVLAWIFRVKKSECEKTNEDNYFYWSCRISGNYNYLTHEFENCKYEIKPSDECIMFKIICYCVMGIVGILGVCCFVSAIKWKFIPEIEILNWINNH